jgi:membrane-bound ClpP family serine protease
MSEFDGTEIFFLICASVGGFFVVVKMFFQFLGGDSDTHIDTDMQIDSGSGHVDSDIGFKLLSLHGLSSFLLMFGLVGLALYHESRFGVAIAVAGGVAAGLAAVWVIGKLFKIAVGLQSSGTLPTMWAVGCSGTVYLRIPEQGTGRVNISFENRLREFDAVSIDGKTIPTGTAIKVVQVNANVLVVEILK